MSGEDRKPKYPVETTRFSGTGRNDHMEYYVIESMTAREFNEGENGRLHHTDGGVDGKAVEPMYVLYDSDGERHYNVSESNLERALKS